MFDLRIFISNTHFHLNQRSVKINCDEEICIEITK